MQKIITELKQILSLETDAQLNSLLRVPKAVMSRIKKDNQYHDDHQAKRGLTAVCFLLRRLSESEIDEFKNELMDLEIAELKQNYNLTEK